MAATKKPSFQEFQAACLELVANYRTQLLIRNEEGLEQESRRKLVERLLAPYRELEPHDDSLLDLITGCYDLTDPDEITQEISTLYQARYG
jgi:hypothetical protein